MANYKYAGNLHHNTHDDFDQEYAPGVAAPYPGIYKCVSCDNEIVVMKGALLPAEIHSQHCVYQPVKWKLIVCAVQKE